MVGRRMDKDAFGDRKKKQGIRLSPTKKYSGKDKGKVVKRANTTGRGTPTQYRKSHEDPDMGRYQQKVTQGRSSVKDLKKESVEFFRRFVLEADKKGKGSGKKDACYHKVKASAKVWPSAYASGRLVQCRKKGAANYGKGSD
jgi:hypothetical protein